MGGLLLGRLCMCIFEEGVCSFMGLDCFAICKRYAFLLS